MSSCYLYHHHTPQPFYGPFSGITQVSRCQKKASSGLYGAREYIRRRHTDNPAGCHSIRTNQRPTSILPPIFKLDALPAATLPIYPGLGQAPNLLACIPSGVVFTAKQCLRFARDLGRCVHLYGIVLFALDLGRCVHLYGIVSFARYLGRCVRLYGTVECL